MRNSQFWTVWKSNSTVLEASTWKLEYGQLQSVPLRKHCELVTVTQFQSGKTFCTLNWWFQKLHYQLVEKLHYQLLKIYTINYSKTTLSTTLESGNWKKLTISECPMEEAMRIGHWVTIQQFHSGKNFLHYELVISSKWKQSGVTDGFKIPDLS